MAIAPKDGSVIEILNTAGLVPHTSFHRWSGKLIRSCITYDGIDGLSRSQRLEVAECEPCWVDIHEPGTYYTGEEACIHWKLARPI
jgi:hypothetical protein